MGKLQHRHLTNGTILGSIRELVFGLEDSLVSTLGVVVGVAAGAQDPKVVILSGIVLVVVEALSMAAGSFLSSKSHREMLEQAISEERHEIETEPEEEKEELRHMYKVRGFTDEEIEILVRRVTGDKQLWLEEMMAKELKIGAGELVETPKKNAFVMFASYVVGGIVPVFPFAVLPIATASVVSTALTIIALFGVGFAKAKLTSTDGIKSGIEMVAVAGAAAGLGYLIGRIVGAAFGIEVS